MLRADQPRNCVKAFQGDKCIIQSTSEMYFYPVNDATCQSNSYLHELFILFVKWFAILPVVESCNANNFFFFIDNRQGKNIFNSPSTVIQRLRLQKQQTSYYTSKHQDLDPAVYLECTWNLNISSDAAFMMLQILNMQ